MTDDVIKVFDDVIIFETYDQVIFITYSLKIKCIKFHGFSMKRTGFIVIFLLWAKKPARERVKEQFSVNKISLMEAISSIYLFRLVFYLSLLGQIPLCA